MAELVSLHLLVTRPNTQAQPWAQLLMAAGARVTQLPVLTIEPFSHDSATQPIKKVILALDTYHKAIFVSQNAVTYGTHWIDRYWPQLPAQLLFFAVGASTASLLEKQLQLDPGTVGHGQQAMNSEALLELAPLQCVAQEKILLLRGRGGRTLLGDTLSARGARVDSCELYRRGLPESLDHTALASFMASDRQTVITVHSGESLANLCQLTDTTQRQWLRQQPLLVPGQRVAQQAQDAGFNRCIVAANATDSAMLEALQHWKSL